MKRKLCLAIIIGALMMIFSDCEKNDLGTCTATCVCQGCTTTSSSPNWMRKECNKDGFSGSGCCTSNCTYSFQEE
jgi:hypothetical protein